MNLAGPPQITDRRQIKASKLRNGDFFIFHYKIYFQNRDSWPVRIREGLRQAL